VASAGPCKSAPCSRQITTPAPHHSVFYRPDALPAAQPTTSHDIHVIRSMTVICSVSMPAGFRRHLVGKVPRNVCYSDIDQIGFVSRPRLIIIMDTSLNTLVEFYVNNTINRRPLLRHFISTPWSDNSGHNAAELKGI